MDDWPLQSLEDLLYMPPFHVEFDFNDLNEPNIPEMPEAYVDIRTPPPEVRSQVELSPAAAAFIAEHTTVVIDVPTTDECPICLDNYTAGVTCVQIKDIGSCKHRFCQSCVGALVSGHTNADLRCPSCRAVWIPSATAGTRPLGRNTHAQPGDQQNLSAAAQPFVPGQRVVIDLDAEDYNAEVQNFNQFTRDIEDVRARARNTGGLSRSQRRQEMQDETTRRRAAERETRRTTERESNRAQARARLSALAQRGLNRSRTSAPTPAEPAAQERTWIKTSAQQAGQLGAERSSTARSPVDMFQTRASSSTLTQHAPQAPTERPITPSNPFSLRISACQRPDLTPLPVESSAIPSIPGPAREPVVSSAGQVDQGIIERGVARSNQDVQREQALNTREKDLNVREKDLNVRETTLNTRQAALNAREKELNTRETTLNGRATTLNTREDNLNSQEARINKRLTNLLAKEKDVKAREERTDKVAQLAQKQREEMKKVVKRQKEEMDRAMRGDVMGDRHRGMPEMLGD
jgi:hypothetical protein